MQLNNINGQVVKIDTIYVSRNRVDYSIYEYGGSSIIQRKSHAFGTITLVDYLTQETNFENLCYTTLAAELDPGYSISEDKKNWVISTGSTGEDTAVRVYIPATTLNSVLHTGNPLDSLLKQMEVLAPQVVRLDNGSHQYLIYIEDVAKTILEGYPEIIMESKIPSII